MSTEPASIEEQDAQLVDNAIEAMNNGDIQTFANLLLDVIQRCPADYANEFERDGKLHVRFWSQADFFHYVMWHKTHGTDREVVWLGNAHPRAHYYMGFLGVKVQKYDEAIDFLNTGRALEPQNPMFLLETGQALIGVGRLEEALQLYSSITTPGPYVSPLIIARAARGRGATLIEMGCLKEARAAFEHSLTLEPGNKVALNELLYIESLKRGGQAGGYSHTEVTDQHTNVCSCCAKPFNELQIVTHKGTATFMCQACAAQSRKPWWRFWN